MRRALTSFQHTNTTVNRFFFCMTLVLAVFFFFACETGSDPDNKIPLPAPRSVQVTAKHESLVLQWTKVASAQGIVPTYKVYYSIGTNPNASTEWEEVIPNTSQLVTSTITGLDNNKLVNHTPYYVWVKAIYADLGESDFSEMTYGIPIPPPTTPSVLTIVDGEQMLQLTWPEVTDAFTYEVYYKAGGTGDTPPPDTEETMKTVSEAGSVIFGLTNGTNYMVWVRAINTAGKSPGYAKNTGTPQLATSPPTTAPAKPTVVSGDKKLTLTWNQAAGVPSYKLYYGTTIVFSAATAFPAGAATIPANAPTVSADITGLTNGTPYYVWVQSWNSQSN
jgi:hypothetical protein